MQPQVKAQLQAGKNVCYRSSGWSLYPRVHSNDQTTYEPVNREDQVAQNDIVFCQVFPHLHFYAHLVKKKEWWRARDEWCFTISNAAGWENGWCFMELLHGKFVQVEH